MCSVSSGFFRNFRAFRPVRQPVTISQQGLPTTEMHWPLQFLETAMEQRPRHWKTEAHQWQNSFWSNNSCEAFAAPQCWAVQGPCQNHRPQTEIISAACLDLHLALLLERTMTNLPDLMSSNNAKPRNATSRSSCELGSGIRF